MRAPESAGARRCATIRGGGRRLMKARKDEKGAGNVEYGEKIEVRRHTPMMDECRGHQASEEVAGDVAGNIGGKGSGGVLGTALLGKIGERERERRGHEQALDDAQHRKDGEARRRGEE